MSEFTIEKGVPIASKKGSGRSAKYPWHELEVGDSFFVPGKSGSSFTLASSAGKRLGRRFTTRTVDGGVRVWRTE